MAFREGDMEQGVFRYGRRLLALSLIVAVAAISTGGNSREHSEESKAKKVWSGISYADRTLVARLPGISNAAAAFDAERAWSGYDDWEPAIAADPSSNYVYQMTTRYNGPSGCNGCAFPRIIFRRSSDSGATWSADMFLNNSKKSQNDPQIEVATDGTIYALWLDEYTPGTKFIKSTNRGTSWSTPIQFTGKGKKPSWNDKPILAISPNGQHVYIALNASDAYVTSSHDYGATFSPLVKTNNDGRYWFHYAGAVANNGDVYFAAIDYSQDYTGNAGINVIRSTNAGGSWTTMPVDTSAEMPGCGWADGCYFGFLGSTAGIAIDSTGRIVLAYNAGNSAGGPQSLYVRTSLNGVNWSSRTELSGGSVNNSFPAVAKGPSAGDFRVIWQDDRNGSTNRWNTWYRRTTDGGNSWSAAVRLSDQGSGAPYKFSTGYKFPYGDYLELAVDASGRNHFIWGEGDSYNGPGGTWYSRGQ
jgi:hypothetical protein